MSDIVAVAFKVDISFSLIFYPKIVMCGVFKEVVKLNKK